MNINLKKAINFAGKRVLLTIGVLLMGVILSALIYGKVVAKNMIYNIMHGSVIICVVGFFVLLLYSIIKDRNK